MWLLVLATFGVFAWTPINITAYHAALDKHCLEREMHRVRLKDCKASLVPGNNGIGIWPERIVGFMRLLNRTLAYRCPFRDELDFCISLGDHNEDVPGFPFLVNNKYRSEPSSHILAPSCVFGGWPIAKDWIDYEDLYHNMIAAARRNTWATRETKVFWRGSGCGYRCRIQELSNNDTQLKPYMDMIRDPLGSDRVSLTNHTRYKYLIDIEGTTASFRQASLFLAGAVLIRQDPHLHHFTNEFIPWEHFVPIDRDGTELPKVMQLLLHNDTLAQRIAHNGFLRATHVLSPGRVYFEFSNILKELHKMIYGMGWTK